MKTYLSVVSNYNMLIRFSISYENVCISASVKPHHNFNLFYIRLFIL